MRAPLILAVSLAGETGRHDAAKFILQNDAISARAAIVGLGTSNRICLGNKGRIDVEIIVRGKSAHSSMPEKGVNAVDGFRRVMERLDRLPLRAAHPGLGSATLTVTQVRSAPDISHTIPDVCRVVLDRRLLPGEDPDAAFHEIHDALKEVAGWSVEVNRGAFMYPSEVAKDCALAAATASASRELSKREARVVLFARRFGRRVSQSQRHRDDHVRSRRSALRAHGSRSRLAAGGSRRREDLRCDRAAVTRVIENCPKKAKDISREVIGRPPASAF